MNQKKLRHIQSVPTRRRIVEAPLHSEVTHVCVRDEAADRASAQSHQARAQLQHHFHQSALFDEQQAFRRENAAHVITRVEKAVPVNAHHLL